MEKKETYKINFKSIVVSPSNTCSGGCSYCYAKSRLTKDKKVKKRIDDCFLEKIFRYIADSPFVDKNCSITLGGGGDPLEIFDIYLNLLSFAKQFQQLIGKKISIFVGTCDPRFITQEKINHILRSQSALGISIDGPSNAAYLSRRITTTCLNSLRKIKGVSLCASGVFTRTNCRYIKDIYEFYMCGLFESFQLRPIRLPHGDPQRLTKYDLMKTYKIYESFIYYLIQEDLIETFLNGATSADCFGGFFYKYLLKIYKTTRCGAGIKVAFLNLDGNLYLCPSLAFPEIRIGHIENLQKVEKNIIEKNLNKIKCCSNCSIFNVCGGPCLSESYLKYNALGEIDPDICEFQVNMAHLAERTVKFLVNERTKVVDRLIKNYNKKKMQWPGRIAPR